MTAKLEKRQAEHRILDSGLTVLPSLSARDEQLLRLGLMRKGSLTSDDVSTLSGEITVAQLRDYVDDYLGECILCNKPKTLSDKTDHFTKFFWYLHRYNHQTVTEKAARGFFAYILNGHLHPQGRWEMAGTPDGSRFRQPVTQRTVQAYYVTIRTLYKWMLKKRFILNDPTAEITIQRPKRKPIEPFTLQQIEALIRAARRSENARRDEAVIRFMFDTGLREAEFCNMKLVDLNFNTHTGGTVRVLGKGDKERVVPFSMKARTALCNYLAPEPEQMERAERNGKRRAKRKLLHLQATAPPTLKIWISQRGQDAGHPLTPNGLYRLYRRLGEDAGITNLRCSPHTMRHSFAVHFLRNGGSLKVLQDLLGHTDISTTQIYLNLSDRDLQAEHFKCSPGDALGI